MPKDWVFHTQTTSWYGPTLPEVVEEEVSTAPEDTNPDVIVEVPEPWENEKYFSWRSRVLKSDVRLKALPDVQTVLSQVWKDKSFEQGIQL